MLLMAIKNQQTLILKKIPSKYLKADAEHSVMALLETDDPILYLLETDEPLTSNFHELSAELIQQLSTSKKITRKSENSLGETNECDHISDEEIGSDGETLISSADLEDEEDIPDLDDDWLFNNSGSPQNRSSITIKEHGAIVLGYSVRHNCIGEAIKDLLKLTNIHAPESSHTFNSTDKLRNAIGK